jgi:Zn-dependent protease
MKWSYKLGEWFGIAVRVHATFLLMLGWIAFGTYSDTKSALAVLFSVLFMLAVFCLVVLHEYGHALTARHFGIRTRNITLYPIGGVALLEGMPKRPREQLLVALAGPAVNFLLAGGTALVMMALGQPLVGWHQLGDDPRSLLGALFVANILMGSFNLLPALPMDGGRVVRALLAMRLGPVPATRIAAALAKVVAVLMAGYALSSGHTMLAVIAVVVWLGSSAESQNATRMGRVDERGRTYPPAHSTQVLYAPLEGEAEHAEEPTASPVQVGGVVLELVQTPDGPRMRYSRIR